MQSNRTRILVGIGSIAVIAVLLVVLGGSGDDGDDDATLAGSQTTISAEPSGSSSGGGAKPKRPAKPAEPKPAAIVVAGGEPKGGIQEIDFRKGDDARIEVRSDAADEVHVHGYDLIEDVEAGGKVEFDFKADIDGVFEIELEGSGTRIAQLTVNP